MSKFSGFSIKNMQLYIHVPFCKSKCRYCDFNSYACHDKQAIFEYLNVLDDEISLQASNTEKRKQTRFTLAVARRV